MLSRWIFAAIDSSFRLPAVLQSRWRCRCHLQLGCLFSVFEDVSVLIKSKQCCRWCLRVQLTVAVTPGCQFSRLSCCIAVGNPHSRLSVPSIHSWILFFRGSNYSIKLSCPYSVTTHCWQWYLCFGCVLADAVPMNHSAYWPFVCLFIGCITFIMGCRRFD